MAAEQHHGDDPIEHHLREALHADSNDDAKYHLREAMQLRIAEKQGVGAAR